MNPLKTFTVAVAVVIAAVTIPAAVAGASPAPTVGTIGGGTPLTVGYSGNPGAVTAQIDCSPITDRITIRPSSSALNGWTNGQYITYRYHLRSRTSGWTGTSGWAGATFSARNYGITAQPTATVPAVSGHSWDVSVQTGWWDGTRWVYSNWYGPTGGYTQNFGFAQYTSCLT